MELDLFHVNLVCDHQTVDFLLIIRSGFQVEPDTEHAICRVIAGFIRDDRLPVADHHALIVRHVDGVSAGLDLIAHGLTLMELQRENQVGNLAAFAQKFQLRVLNLDVILVARAEVLEGNHRHDKLLQADTAVDIVLTTALNLHADGVLRGIALDGRSVQLPFQIDGKQEISSCVRSSQRITPSKLIHVAREGFPVNLVALIQRLIGIEEAVIRRDENICSAQFVHDDTQDTGKLLNCRLAGVKDFGLRRGFVSDGVDGIVIDVYYIFSGNQLPPFILLHVQKVIVLNGNAGFRRRVQDRVSLHGGTGGISVNENVHTVVHRNALSRKKCCHTKLRDGREDCLHRL